MRRTAVNDVVTGFKWVGTRPIRPDGVPKVTGRAMYGADLAMAGALVGRILRSPHAHARIRSIDTSKAAALPGVKAVMTAADFPDHKFEYVGPERVAVNFWHVTIARVDADGQAEIWASSQGHFVVRALTAKLLGMNVGDLRVTPAEIGGGFGGKTVVYLEPVAALLSKKTGRPVKITMTRDEVFKATGPTSGASMWVKMGVKKDGTIPPPTASSSSRPAPSRARR